MNPDPSSFQDKVALITGASSGIGKASALEFARRGARVALADIDEIKGQQTLREIQQMGAQGFFRKTDVSRAQDVESLINEVLSVYGRLDFAHNNAGIEGRRARIASYSEDEWDQVINVNLKGVWLCMKYEIPVMLKAGKGAIVNTASIAALVGLRKFGPYAASKHGIAGLTKSAVLEYAQAGIRVNAICPGVIDTDMVERTLFKRIETGSALSTWVHKAKKRIAYQFFEKERPAGRMGQPEEIARVAVWLCSDEASFVNGAVLPVDGGYVAD